ncbi:hypothetical protein [Pseudorhodoferax sp. Leaf267]|uniref:hypothetical protein n=1 Tax=Pseudorhodoferax sp. Leaf267 TaxID=1736316 RepID=UPI0012E103D2|nr:hypothetical protein [Pseudorhodoferax sp. Leaf267]
MTCIACGREGHCSSSCPHQLWRWATPAPVPPAPAAQPATPRRPPAAASHLRIDSHDRALEAWTHFA